MIRKIILTMVIISVIGDGAWVTTSAFAQSPTPGQDPVTSLVQKIAQKFGLREADVRAVFDQYVKDGEITGAQKQLIIKKHKELVAELQTDMQSMKGKTPVERKAAVDAKRKALDDWEKQNGVGL
jgi:polyhydroxyalkanoate synthesis regulator phasin